MTEEEWLTSGDVIQMLRHISPTAYGRRAGPLRKADLLGAACAARIWDELTDDYRQAVLQLEAAIDDPTVRYPAQYGDEWEGLGSWIRPSSAQVEDVLNITHDILSRSWELDPISEVPGELDRVAITQLARDIFGNPFRPVSFAPKWRSSSAVGLSQSMYESRDFSPMPILADALEEAGCDNADLLAHCRAENAVHVRGCWVVDLVLGKA